MERRLMSLAEDDGRSQEEVKDDEGKAKAVIATKTGNISVRFGSNKFAGKFAPSAYMSDVAPIGTCAYICDNRTRNSETSNDIDHQPRDTSISFD